MVKRQFSPPKAQKAFRRTRQNAVAFGGQTVKLKMYYTYILLCIDYGRNRRDFYVGSTQDLKERVSEHKAKKVKTTKSFDEITLVYYEACLNKADAIKREIQLKTGFGRGYLKKRIDNYMSMRD